MMSASQLVDITTPVLSARNGAVKLPMYAVLTVFLAAVIKFSRGLSMLGCVCCGLSFCRWITYVYVAMSVLAC